LGEKKEKGKEKGKKEQRAVRTGERLVRVGGGGSSRSHTYVVKSRARVKSTLRQRVNGCIDGINDPEQLQQFGKPTWHPYNFGKTRKIDLQQFGKPTWQK
jgi:hypothetical protein